MNWKIKTGTVGYSNKILVSDEKFSLGKNDKVNSLEVKSHKYSNTNSLQGLAQKPNISHKKQSGALPGPQTTTHNEEKIALVLFLTSGFAIWNMFSKYNNLLNLI